MNHIEPEFFVTHLGQYRVTEEAAEQALATIDQDGIWQAYRDSLTCTVWDRSSPINGVRAENVLANRREVTEHHDVLLISDGSGKVVFFQPIHTNLMHQHKTDEVLDDITSSHTRSVVIAQVTALLCG